MRERRIRVFAWSLGLAVGGLQAWLMRQQLSSDDVIAYLDIGDAYLRGDWRNAVNAYWSPLYSWLLGATLRVVKPSAAWEFPIVKIVNLAIFAFAFISFEIFWRRIMIFVDEINDSPLPRGVLLALGYALFLWTSLTLIGVSCDTPDMLVAAFTYLAAAFALRLRSRGTFAWSVALGATLGLGYLAKAALFPMAFVVLFVVAIATRPRRFTLVAAATFTLIAAPFVAVLSHAKGRLTFGDTGRLNYIWSMTRDVRPYRFWYRVGEHGGRPVHPPRVMSTRPEVFEFAQPVGGTYPPWHDPSYWYEGVEARVRPAVLWTVVLRNAWYYATTFAIGLTAAWIAFVGIRELPEAIRRMRRTWIITVPALCGLGLYFVASDLQTATIVTQPSTRFVAAFVVLLAAGLTSVVRRNAHTTRVVVAAVGLACGSLVWTVATQVMISRGESARIAQDQTAVADTLRSLGLGAGDHIAISGYYVYPYFHWARLSRVTIVGEIPLADFFWEQPPDRRAEILDGLRRTGARALIQRPPIAPPVESAWLPVGYGYYLLWL